MKRAKRAKTTPDRSQTRNKEAQKLPFIEHLYELRKRLFYVVASIATFSLLAYSVEHSIISLLLKPAGNQHFIYTSPIGGLDFLFRVCIYIGIALSIPVIVYQFLRYIEPLLQESSMRFIMGGSLISGALAIVGILFGYMIGLPAALHFLLHQFINSQVQALITIQSYMAFVTVYMLGSALLFQVPLILIFINRIKPLNPKKLFSLKYQRWVILGSFIGGGIMNPNPNLLDQIVVVGPLILMYQVGVAIIWMGRRKHQKPAYLSELLQRDSDVRAIREERFNNARRAWVERQHERPTQPVPQQPKPIFRPATPAVTPSVVTTPKLVPAAVPAVTPAQRTRPTSRPITRRYVSDFGPGRPMHTFSQRISPGTA